MNAEYQRLLGQAQSLLSSESDPIANAANLSALIFNSMDDLNWAGFYFLQGQELVLGPFNGQVACTRIALGRGVCGTAYFQSKTLVVDDVHEFEGHIACDAASESEIVVPFTSERLSGVLDIDSPIKARFADKEKWLFEEMVGLYKASL